MLNTIFIILCLSLTISTICLTISKSKLFASMHDWFKPKDSDFDNGPCSRLNRFKYFIGELLECTYCLSHWVSLLVAIFYHPVITNIFILDFIAITFILVGLASWFSRVTFSSIDSIK